MTLYEHAIAFIENLTLIDDYTGEEIVLRDFQKQILKGLLKQDSRGKRLVSKALLLLPRKNAKTVLLSALCAFFLFTHENQQIVCAASTEKQANIVFDCLRKMIEADDVLRSLCEIVPSTGRIICHATNTVFARCSSGADSLHGLNPSIVLVDEVFALKSKRHRSLFTALTTGSGARKSKPLVVMISTMGDSARESLLWTEFEYARTLKGRIENGKVIKNGKEDPSYFAALYFCDPLKDDWMSPAVHRKVNPAYGDFLNLDEFNDRFKEAIQMPSRRMEFQQFRLNMLGVSASKWMPMERWNLCKAPLPDLTQYKCIGAGLDIAPVRDLSAFVMLFQVENKIALLPFAWCNDADISERTKVEGVPYKYWQEKGFIKLTEGSSTDFDIIKQDLIELCEKYNVPIIGADLMKGWEVAQGIAKHGIEIQAVKPYFTSISPPMKRLEKLVIDQKLLHSDHPVMNYCIGNVIAETDGQDLIRPSNKLRRKQDKIDLAVATILGLAVCPTEEPEESVYANDDSIWL